MAVLPIGPPMEMEFEDSPTGWPQKPTYRETGTGIRDALFPGVAMAFHLAASVVLAVHLAFILFALFGAFLVSKWRWLALAQLPAAAWGIFVEAAGQICPLTTWENGLLARAGQAGYPDGFIVHYLSKIIYPGDLTQAVQVALAGLLVAVNAGIYGWIFLLRHR